MQSDPGWLANDVKNGCSELPWVRGIPRQLDIDLLADIHPGTQPKVHSVWAIDKVLELLSGDPFTHFPDAEGRAFRTNRAEAVVVETSF